MRRALALAALAAVAAIGYSAPAAQAEDAPFVDWNPLLPGLPTPYRPSREKDCLDGSNQCIEETLAAMYKRFDRLWATCDHNAVFSLTYIRVTESIRKSVLDGLYDEPKFLNHEDKVFARMYFDSTAAWERGQSSKVPTAWRIALDAGKARNVNGLGNLLMSMNAHVNRDMPFMLDALGLTRPDGVNRKLDHDKGNRVLSPLFDDVITELTARFDASTDDVDLPGTLLDDLTLFQILQGWREQVWRHAELLHAAETLGAKQAVAAFIETYSAALGMLIQGGATIDENTSKRRDAHCAEYKRTHRETGGQLAAAAHKNGLKAKKGVVRLRVRCPELRDCAGNVLLTRAGRPMSARVPVGLRAGEAKVVSLKLKTAARRAVKKRGKLAVRAATASPSPWGTTRTADQLTRVRR